MKIDELDQTPHTYRKKHFKAGPEKKNSPLPAQLPSLAKYCRTVKLLPNGRCLAAEAK